MSANDGGPAFPSEGRMGDVPYIMTNTGMTLRDWFAGKAMQTLIKIGAAVITSNETSEDQPWYFGNWEHGTAEEIRGVDVLAADAYYVADAMLRQRKFPKENLDETQNL